MPPWGCPVCNSNMNVTPAFTGFNCTGCNVAVASCLGCADNNSKCGSCTQYFCDVCLNLACGQCGEDVACCVTCRDAENQCYICTEYFCKYHIVECGCGGNACYYHLKVLPDGDPMCENCVEGELSSMTDRSMVIVACVSDETMEPPEPDDSALLLFDPPIELYTYKHGQSLQKKKDPSVKGMNLEHGVPNNCFIQGKGRKGPTVPRASGYSEGEALVFPIGDDQSPGTEHKFMTNRERAFAKECHDNNQYPTVDQTLRVMEPAWVEMLLKFRTYKGKTTGMTPIQIQQAKRKAAEEAAYATRYRFERHFKKKLHVSLKRTRLKNGLASKNAKAPKKKLKKSRKYDI